jgi:hypothetical protein
MLTSAKFCFISELSLEEVRWWDRIDFGNQRSSSCEVQLSIEMKRYLKEDY